MLEIHQLLAGRDFGQNDDFAVAMINCAYLVVESSSKEAVLVDPAWDIEGLLRIVDSHGCRLMGAVATHGHWDHIGGCFQGRTVEGIARLVQLRPVPVLVQEKEMISVSANIAIEHVFLRAVSDEESFSLGGERISFLHTPGHTPGCQCVRAENAVLTGDTLFVGECGRVDLPGSDANQMRMSLKKLAALPDETVVYPGHHYGSTLASTIGRERKENPHMQSL